MAEQGFTLTSPDFVPDGLIPATLTCDGNDTSPELKWMHPPEGTRSYALIMEDPDAPVGTFTHWILADIPANRTSLPPQVRDVGVTGRNDFQHSQYGGPCPPPNGGQHRYFFRLFALDVESLNVAPGASRAEVLAAMQGHVLDQAELMGRFERKTH